MANNTRVVTYDGGTLNVRDVLDNFKGCFIAYNFGPEDLNTIHHAIDLFEEIDKRGSKALLDVNVDDLITLEMDVNYIRTQMNHIGNTFEIFYQLLANIRMIKQHCELDRIVGGHNNISYTEMFYAKNDVEMTKEILNRYFGVAKIKEEEKMNDELVVIGNPKSSIAEGISSHRD